MTPAGEHAHGRGPRGGLLPVLPAAIAVALLAGCGGGGSQAVPSPAGPPAAAAPTASVNTGARVPPARLAEPPAAGTVQVEAGPFTDRVRLAGLRLRPGRRPVVTGRLVNLTDVSEVIVLELQADFYDRRGRLLASGTQVFDTAAAEPYHGRPLPFAVRAARPAAGAVAALLTVPQLVNE